MVMKSLFRVFVLGVLVASLGSLVGCLSQRSKSRELVSGGSLEAVSTVQRDLVGTQVSVIDRFYTQADGTVVPLCPASGASPGLLPGVASGAGMVGAAVLWPANRIGGASATATSGPSTSNASAASGP